MSTSYSSSQRMLRQKQRSTSSEKRETTKRLRGNGFESKGFNHVKCRDGTSCEGSDKGCSFAVKDPSTSEVVHTCVCAETGLPTSVAECPRNLIQGTTHPTPIVFQPPGSNATSDPAVSQSPHHLTLTLAISIGSLLLLALVTLLGLYKWRALKRLFQLNNAESKFELHGLTNPNGRLLPDRFILNPTYDSVAVELSVRVIPPEQVTMLSQIGQGCFGKVFKGEYNETPVAVKVMKEEHSMEVMKEVETMSAFSHQNILEMIGIVKGPEMDVPWLVFEFMEFGDLASVLRHRGTPPVKTSDSPHSPPSPPDNKDPLENPSRKKLSLSRDSLMNIAYQIAEGMKYLSSQHFVHRDLAARNCLVGENGIVKISDFGLSRDVYTCDYYKIGGSRLLPVRWMSYESILYGKFTLESDAWAYGVLLWEIYSWGKQPYFGHSNEEVVQLILDGVLLCPSADCPPMICEIMAGCWKTDPKDRLTFPNICEKFQKAFKGEEEEEENGDYEVPKPKQVVEYMQVF